ncbi:hypothetical protein CANTEDRAFT_114631 [Yamadazyma tenuis ATCC 10573]|uniref:PAP1-domain-containing protein n=1 Tax=Candida tenuis (strain ATCC 10573 / BCRC 21748 / CBS 615 / JCM 9827 / NBRC 10315 / NRRL Y-1498 / VKM Y-70) TaxID=590646 RepID=G3B5Y6_CANTC|nr:PAP1-domain-containing protein [Yamadazyma tenuis ATCC 10573]XP_006687433.1 uncharacterized protein CANTEDRAFT_114631 [Yamadazyma tenuis ATCC 10573]EGV63639.1 PAP1-domain-containing protein [Yamadazyma tenuis ATCC 10573]EGV63640.1 hypothetical protein CANTEDRAFT_114631 [Yamadazyma tenuis ATCC 10573]
MADIKRHHDELASASPVDYSDLDGSKKHVKPGRKPIESEPKSKRTAQNRAAQRAYRERKERKMKDLEEKVELLQDENLKMNTESDFLRAQIDMLKNELIKVKGDDFELNLPQRVGKLTKPSNHSNSSNTLNSKSSSDFSDSRSVSSSVNDSSPNTDVSENILRSEFPWSKNNLQLNQTSYEDRSIGKLGYNNVPDLVSGSVSSNSNSPLNDNILFEGSERFEEQSDPFCKSLNEVCGTKECPVPKYKQKQQQQQQPTTQIDRKTPQALTNIPTDMGKKDSISSNSPFSFFNNDQLFADPFSFNLTPKNDDNDPLSFLNDNNFDVNLAFDDGKSGIDHTSLDSLVTEESLYDPLRNQQNNNFNLNEFVKTSFSDKSSSGGGASQQESVPALAEDDEVVPAPEKTFKCSEIWDRITSHPRYTEIDIDGLCSELKTKARCSERGVVVNASDVNTLLEQSATKR